MLVEDKCKDCKVFSVCPHCAADCVNEEGAVLTKTTSVCNFTRIEVYYARKYWKTIKSLHPNLYKNIEVDWTEEEQEELMSLILKEIIKMS